MSVRELSAVEALRATITTFRDLLVSHQEVVNQLNVYPVPDGDTGTNMRRTLDAVVVEMDTAAADDLAATCAAVAHGALMGARGNSGVIVSQILRGLSGTWKTMVETSAGGDTASTAPGLSGERFAAALTSAAEQAYTAVLNPVEGTILTVVRESAEAATAAAASGAPLAATVRAARDGGRASLERTPELLPVLAAAGVVDSGGAGFVLLLDAALHVVDGEPLPEPPEHVAAPDLDAVGVAASTGPASATAKVGGAGELDVSEQRYEVMFLCSLADEHIDEFKQGWGRIGDSIVVVGGDGTWNCHVHTNDIGAAIEVPLELGGRPFQIRVTDLFEEVAAEHEARESALAAAMHGVSAAVAPQAELPAVGCAVVAVSSGDGISALFHDLGVQVIVNGGQTLNPSTAELLAAVEATNSDHVVVLPGNKNIIPVAEQVDALTSKTVRVVPTRSMPEGLAALMAYDPEADAPSNSHAMLAAADAVVTGEITAAVRDTTTDAGAVREGDWIGIVRGDGIVAIAADVVGAATQLLEHLLDNRELVTLIAGTDARDDHTAAIETWLAAEHPDVELEIHDGGQPLYPYLFGVE